jgi:hypothetical protein
MKNIHVLKTDKPTSLFIIEGKLYNYHKPQQCDGVDKINVNIYITSDEQLKYNDYYTVDGKKIYYCNTLNPSRNNHDKKIILTTDQDLIKDGVQAIDDEFLEWFVKNPSCEEVEIDTIETLTGSFDAKGIKSNYVNVYKIIIPKEKTKQETLEEVAERILANNIDGLRDALKDDDLFFFYKGVVQCYGEAMAKYEKQRIYNQIKELYDNENITGFSKLAYAKCLDIVEQFDNK